MGLHFVSFLLIQLLISFELLDLSVYLVYLGFLTVRMWFCLKFDRVRLIDLRLISAIKLTWLNVGWLIRLLRSVF